MNWRNFKVTSSGQKPQKSQKLGEVPPSVVFVPFVPRGGSQKMPLSYGITLADLEAEFGNDPLWRKAREDQRWLPLLAESLYYWRLEQTDAHKASGAKEQASDFV